MPSAPEAGRGAAAPRTVPPLALHGEQGTAKSTTGRTLRDLIDPKAAPMRSEPRNGHDLMIAAHNGWLLAFDNVSRLSPWLSDAICRLATGGGFATRELYSDTDEVLIDVQRPPRSGSATASPSLWRWRPSASLWRRSWPAIAPTGRRPGSCARS